MNGDGQCEVHEPNTGFVAIATGGWHALGLKADGSIVAWGLNDYGQCDVPEPNEGFIAVAAGRSHSLGLKGIFGDFDVDGDVDLDDLGTLDGCLTGPGVFPPVGCARMSLDGDVDVDVADFAVFQRKFTGASE